jgi:hypothetical protein
LQQKWDIFDDTVTSRRPRGVLTGIMAMMRSFDGV